MAKHGSEIIAFHFCRDISDITECVYQPGTYHSPRVYAIGDDYYCAPTARQKLPRDRWAWREIGEHYGRKVYCSKLGEVDDE